MDANEFDEEAVRQNNIEIPQVIPRQRRDRIEGAFHALNQDRRLNDHRYVQLNQRIDNVQESIQDTIHASINGLRDLLLDQRQPPDFPAAPPSILSNASHGGNLSQIGSVQSSRAPSRSNSPTRDKGTYPLLQNMAYASKVLLKDKRHRYDEAYDGIRRHITRKSEVYDRVKNDQQIVAANVKSEIVKLLPEMMGLSTNHEAENCYIETIEEHKKNDAIFSQARSHCYKEYPSKLTGPSRNLFYLVRTIIETYNNRLTPSQVKSLIVGTCSEDFKDLIHRFFENEADINSALRTIISIYGKTPNANERISKLHALRIDPKNPIASLNAIFNQIALCYPEADTNSLADFAINYSLQQLPDSLVSAVTTKAQAMKRLKLQDPSAGSMTFPQFLEIVREHQKMNPLTVYKRANVHEVGAKSVGNSAVQALSADLKEIQSQNTQFQTENVKALK